MIKKFLTTLLIFYTTLAGHAYQDCILTSDEKLTDIQVGDETIVSVSPLVTILNEKNTIIIHPLREGETKVCMLKNEKNIIDLNIKVTQEETIVSESNGIDIFVLDEPEEIFEIDEPPIFEEGEVNG